MSIKEEFRVCAMSWWAEHTQEEKETIITGLFRDKYMIRGERSGEE